MKKVITYGSFDLYHYGHQRLLERAKELGDYLIVGITSDDYDRVRGKINAIQPLAERIAAIKATGLADLIIVEEYDGQKIDDIEHYNVDVFTVGDDWKGKFDYLKKYCEVVYLPRTEGVSSTDIRTKQHNTNLGVISDSCQFIKRFVNECQYVNGMNITSICPEKLATSDKQVQELGLTVYDSFDEMLNNVDAVYIKSDYSTRYDFIKRAIDSGKHVLFESPMCLDPEKCTELFELAKQKNIVLMEAIRTAYATAYKRLALLAEIGKIGDILSVDAN